MASYEDRWIPVAKRSVNCKLIVACLVFAVCIGANSTAQDVVADPRLKIEGPLGQLVFVSIRYIDDGTVAKTVSVRHEISTEEPSIQLEFGHAGIQAWVTVPTSNPVTLAMLDGDKPLVEREATSIGTTRLSIGSEVEGNYSPPRVLLNGQERDFVARVVESLRTANTASVVSSSAVANIDWPTLDALGTALREAGGSLQADEGLDGWMSWEGRLGARVFGGRLQFENGDCAVTLMSVEEQLLDANFDADFLDTNWFRGPSEWQPYISDSKELCRALLGGDSKKAHDLFAGEYRKQVTEETLRNLGESLASEFGMLSETLMKRTVFQPGAMPHRSSVFLALTFANKRSAIARVDFVHSTQPGRVGKAELAGIDVRESWPSAQPKQFAAAQFLLDALKQTDAAGIEPRLMAEARAQLDWQRLSDDWQSFRKNLALETAEADWLSWQGQEQDGLGYARGIVESSVEQIDLQIDFVGAEILGFSAVTANDTFCSLEYANVGQAQLEEATGFWTDLLSGNAPSAHSRLAPVFRQQVPLDELKTMAQSAAADLGALRDVEVIDSRLSNRLDRQLPIMVANHIRVSLEDESALAVRCEFGLPEDAMQLQLLNFNSVFSASFPSRNSESLVKLLNALRSSDAQQFVKLLRPSVRADVRLPVLTAFLREFKLSGPKAELPQQMRSIWTFKDGGQRELVSCKLSREGVEIPMQASFQQGNLESFNFELADLRGFTRQIKDWSFLEEIALAFAEDLQQADIDTLKRAMVDELRQANIDRSIEQLREEVRQSIGATMEYIVAAVEPLAGENIVNVQVSLQGQQEHALLQLEFTLDAFSAKVSGAQILKGDR